jgi:hypothetical protein
VQLSATSCREQVEHLVSKALVRKFDVRASAAKQTRTDKTVERRPELGRRQAEHLLDESGCEIPADDRRGVRHLAGPDVQADDARVDHVAQSDREGKQGPLGGRITKSMECLEDRKRHAATEAPDLVAQSPAAVHVPIGHQPGDQLVDRPSLEW